MSASGSPLAVDVVAPARARDLRAFASALVQLTKPSITRMVLVTTACGAVIAPGALHDFARLAWALLGTALIVASANALNMYLEGDVDALMARTRGRPIPSGRIDADAALWFGLVLGFIGLPILRHFVNPLTAFIGGIALLSYVLAYTPMKRVSPIAVWIGAVPGAVPPLMGWTAMTGGVGLGGLSLFLLLFVWQIPHFHAIAVYRMGEYKRAGLKVLPDVRGLEYTKKSIAFLLLLQGLVSLLPVVAGLGGTVYAAVAAVSSTAFFAFGLSGLRASAGARWARTLFFASMPYLLLVFGTLVVTAK